MVACAGKSHAAGLASWHGVAPSLRPSVLRLLGSALNLCNGLVRHGCDSATAALRLGQRRDYLGNGQGERIAQLVIAPVAMLEPVEVAELQSTARGAGGFGSTG